MRSGFYKEIANLKNILTDPHPPRPPHPSLKVELFSPSTGIPIEIVEILNLKLKMMQNVYS